MLVNSHLLINRMTVLFFNFFPRALTGTKQQQLREVCADKQCKTKTGDLPPPPTPNPIEVTRRTPSIYVWLAPISPKTPQGSTLKSCHREKKRKEKKTADLTFWEKKEKNYFSTLLQSHILISGIQWYKSSRTTIYFKNKAEITWNI